MNQSDKTKTCSKCGETKSLGAFYKHKTCKDGVQGHCKLCIKAQKKAYYEANKGKILTQQKAYYEANKEKISALHKDYREANKEKISALIKAYHEANKEKRADQRKARYEVNKDKVSAQQKAYRKANREKINARIRQRYKRDVQFRLGLALRNRLRRAVKNQQRTSSAIRALGCTIKELKRHLEAQFTDGMSWENWALDGWHIDHIKPLASFDLTDRKQLLEACHYTNLQPLWAKENLSKGAAITNQTATP